MREPCVMLLAAEWLFSDAPFSRRRIASERLEASFHVISRDVFPVPHGLGNQVSFGLRPTVRVRNSSAQRVLLTVGLTQGSPKTSSTIRSR